MSSDTFGSIRSGQTAASGESSRNASDRRKNGFRPEFSHALAVLSPLLLHERINYGTPGLHTAGTYNGKRDTN